MTCRACDGARRTGAISHEISRRNRPNRRPPTCRPYYSKARAMPTESALAHRVVNAAPRRTCRSDGSRRVREVSAAEYPWVARQLSGWHLARHVRFTIRDSIAARCLGKTSGLSMTAQHFSRRSTVSGLRMAHNRSGSVQASDRSWRSRSAAQALCRGNLDFTRTRKAEKSARRVAPRPRHGRVGGGRRLPRQSAEMRSTTGCTVAGIRLAPRGLPWAD